MDLRNAWTEHNNNYLFFSYLSKNLNNTTVKLYIFMYAYIHTVPVIV